MNADGGSKLGIDATKKIPGEGFNPDTYVGALIKMDAAVKAKVEKHLVLGSFVAVRMSAPRLSDTALTRAAILRALGP